LVDDYAEYTKILQRISSRYRQACVFVSGSAQLYDPWTENDAQEFINLLGTELAHAGFAVVTGFGVGVGPFVVNGTLAQLEREGTRTLDERLIMRPFPQGIADARERKKRWTAYRTEMLRQAGIAVFVFGNKLDASGHVVDAEGMEEEFELAVSQGLKVVPIGCTGYASKKLHQRVGAAFATYYQSPGYKGLFADLGRLGTPRQTVDRILAIVEKIRAENP
jgi:hypothetical protein